VKDSERYKKNKKGSQVMTNPSLNRVRRKRCFLCGCLYEETYGFPINGEFICGDCLLKYPIRELPKIIMKKRNEDEQSDTS
jgi:uncharacterized protein YbaR (Trm112 family)